MSETTRIVLSGLTGKVGREVWLAAQRMPDMEVPLGITRRDTRDVMSIFGESIGHTEWINYDMNIPTMAHLVRKRAGANAFVDFSHPDVFEWIVELAVRTHVPLISGTSGLSNRQMAMLYNATSQISVFRDDNFRFKVKKFIDEAVSLAQTNDGEFYLYETFWKGKKLPSETSKILQRSVTKATGKTVEVYSFDTFDANNWISDWEFRVRQETPVSIDQKSVHCRVIGFDELARNVLEIAKVMAKKPVKKGEFYDLDEIWDEIPTEAKTVS